MIASPTDAERLVGVNRHDHDAAMRRAVLTASTTLHVGYS
jgi:hypothetical protein